MTEKLEKCRSRNFAIGFVERWIDLAVQDGESMEQVKNNISTFLDKTFGQWKYVLVVYPPHNGGDRHYTNYDVRKFRFYGHNIVLHFLPQFQNSKACKDPIPDKWCSNHSRDTRAKYGFYCTHKNVNAHEWYNWIKNHLEYFGYISVLTVLQGHSFALAGQHVCAKTLSVKSSAKPRCGLNQCHKPPHDKLTIIYA